MTLAQITDVMIGSDINPIYKQRLIRMVKDYIGEEQYTKAIVASTEDKFMINEADIVGNLNQRERSYDFNTVCDYSFKDFSAISNLLFKHGSYIHPRIQKVSQGFIYRSLLLIILMTYDIIQSAMSENVPFNNFYHFIFMLIFSPA